MENNEKTIIGLSMIKIGPWDAIVYKEMTRKEQEELVESLSEEAACHNCWSYFHHFAVSCLLI